MRQGGQVIRDGQLGAKGGLSSYITTRILYNIFVLSDQTTRKCIMYLLVSCALRSSGSKINHQPTWLLANVFVKS